MKGKAVLLSPSYYHRMGECIVDVYKEVQRVCR